MTPEQCLEYLFGILENVVNCTGPERDKLRMAVNIIKTALDEKETQDVVH
jgi:hypothetical protein